MDIKLELAILVFIIIGVTLSVASFNVSLLSPENQPAGQIISTPSGCYYRTVPGEFRVINAAAQNSSFCESYGDNYDPFSFGGILTDTGNHTDSCATDKILNEWTCLNNAAVLTPGECSLGCDNGICVKSRRTLVCEPEK